MNAKRFIKELKDIWRGYCDMRRRKKKIKKVIQEDGLMGYIDYINKDKR